MGLACRVARGDILVVVCRGGSVVRENTAVTIASWTTVVLQEVTGVACRAGSEVPADAAVRSALRTSVVLQEVTVGTPQATTFQIALIAIGARKALRILEVGVGLAFGAGR